MSLPALVPKAVVIGAVTVEIQVKPVFIGRVPLFLLHVTERKKAASHMVEHAVEHNFDAVFVQRIAHGFEVFIRAETAVYFCKITRIVAVVVRFKHRGKIHRADMQLFQVRNPPFDLLNAVHAHAVVRHGRTGKAQGIDLVKHRFICPHCYIRSFQKSYADCNLKRVHAVCRLADIRVIERCHGLYHVRSVLFARRFHAGVHRELRDADIDRVERQMTV